MNDSFVQNPEIRCSLRAKLCRERVYLLFIFIYAIKQNLQFARSERNLFIPIFNSYAIREQIEFITSKD